MRIAFVNAIARLSLVTLALSLLFGPPVQAAPTVVQTVATDITDTRSTDSFFGGLKVKVKLVGDVMAEAKGVRSTLTTAVDNTGRSLVKPGKDDGPSKFNEISSDSPEITLEMASPARTAKTVHKITGTIELFVPKRDPASRVVVSSPMANLGSPLKAEGLGAAGVQVTVWNKELYDAYQKKQDAAEKASEKSNKDDLGAALGAGIKEIFSKMFGGSDSLGPNDVALTITDPKSRLVSAEFEDAAGKQIDPQSSMTGGSSKTFSFDKPLPAGAKLRFYVLTPASIVKVPLTLSDVPLP